MGIKTVALMIKDSPMEPMRYQVSDTVPTAEKRIGMMFEVVDRNHPSDGGPVAISWHRTKFDALSVCSALNIANRV